jgi:hypothetical protein
MGQEIKMDTDIQMEQEIKNILENDTIKQFID